METIIDESVEEKRIYTITLEDGTKIQNLQLNGNNFISNKEIKPEIFEGNLGHIQINDGETEFEQKDLVLERFSKIGDVEPFEWWFVLRIMSNQEIENRKLRADVDFLSMMIDANI